VPILLPLREVVIEGTYGAWVTGTISAKIPMSEARDVDVVDLGMTLCGLLAADNGDFGDLEDDCRNVEACLDEPPPDAAWDCAADGNLPDTATDCGPAWTLLACFEARPVEAVF